MDSGVRAIRNHLFQELKLRCVELSQLALRDDGSKDSTKLLTHSTENLLSFLEQKCQRTDGVFDQKLADYVFFPLSQILRKRKQHTDRLSELTLKCVALLLEYGWRTIELDLGKQLLILLTFVAGGVPGRDAPVSPEEVKSAAFAGLASLFKDLAYTPGGSSSLVDPGTLPAVGHCVTVVLDAMTHGPSSEVQLRALRALEAIWGSVKDAEALASLLPGTISELTKCLTPTTAARRTQKFIVAALEVLQKVITSALSDMSTRSIRAQAVPASEVLTETLAVKTLTPPWLSATSAQIKLALSNVIRLRKHESEDVKRALNHLCLTLLDECQETLKESTAMLIETSMILDCGFEDDMDPNKAKTNLADLATIYPSIMEHVKGTVYNWVTSLPRVMQSNDESAKVAALDQLVKAHALWSNLNLESSILEDSLASSLRDSLSLTIQSSQPRHMIQEGDYLSYENEATMTVVVQNAHTMEFRPILMQEQSQRRVLEKFQKLLESVATQNSRMTFATEMLDYVRSADGPNLLASYWLSANMQQSSIEAGQGLDEFFDTSLVLSNEIEQVNEELFSFSLNVLSDSEQDRDWRVQAIALEVLAHTAQQRKQDFRVDLVDTLYPISALLGASQSQLREHAITCLNIISKACGYESTSDMIVRNADYLVNAISLRLNTFDITPSAPQVLVMMIHLTGPAILPYLDDVVGSIFAALDNFHGYPLLVNSLFSVLGEIVSVGSHSDQLKINFEAGSSQRAEQVSQPPTIEDILSLTKSETNASASTKIDNHEDFPRAPWKSAKTLLDEAAAREREEGDDDAPSQEADQSEELTIPPTKTETLLRTITLHTQYHLTSSSGTLRTKLLSLIQTSILSLSPSSTDFLPLINDIWPVVLARLYDAEPYVQIAAAETLAALCRTAGDFLGTRLKAEWTSIIKHARTVKLAVEKEKKGKSGRGAHSFVSKVWEATVSMFGDMVGYVGVSDGMFDDILDVIGFEGLSRRRDVRGLLVSGRGNTDAVWLQSRIEGVTRDNKIRKRPVMESFHFVEIV